MENDYPSSEAKPINSDLFLDLKDLVDTLIEESSEPLYGLEDEEEEHTIVGDRRELQETNGRVIVARYNDEERTFMADELGLDVGLPYGHIEVEYSSEEAGMDCVLYLGDNNRVLGIATSRIKDLEEVFLEDSHACYEFASSLGLQDLWVDHLYAGEKQTVNPVELSDRQVRDLIEALTNTT